MPVKRSVGLGFVGLGWLGESLIRELGPRFPALRLAAVQDIEAERAAAVAARYGEPWHGTDDSALLEAPGVDAVVISTPNALHFPQTLAALRAGKHVLVQKPLALTPGEARAALALASRAGKLLMVDYTYRYLATTARLRQAAAQVGPARRLRGVFHNVYGPGKAWFFDPWLSGGGALVDLGVHVLDLGLDLLGARAARLETAELAAAPGQPVETAARLAVRLDDVPFEVEVSWQAARPRTEIALELEGARGRARWENVDGSFYRFRTLLDGRCLLDRETTLRADTLGAFARALAAGSAPAVDVRTYELLAAAYAAAGRRSRPGGSTRPGRSP